MGASFSKTALSVASVRPGDLACRRQSWMEIGLRANEIPEHGESGTRLAGGEKERTERPIRSAYCGLPAADRDPRGRCTNRSTGTTRSSLNAAHAGSEDWLAKQSGRDANAACAAVDALRAGAVCRRCEAAQLQDITQGTDMGRWRPHAEYSGLARRFPNLG